MNPEQDPNEQANISGADLAIMVDEIKKLQGEAKVLRDLLKEAHEFLDQDQSGTPTLEKQIEAALRGAT